MAVAGQEQGLDGSRHLATLTKDEGSNPEGVLHNDIGGIPWMPPGIVV
ncbi:MAG: hypothetical protein ACYC46_04235 [Acidobacteriaceae bacterium]